MKKTQIVLFYLIFLLAFISGFDLSFSRIIIFSTIIATILSVYISIRYNILYTISDRKIKGVNIKNIEAFYAIIVIFIWLDTIGIGLESDGLKKDFFNFYYLLSLPVYFLFLIRVKKE
jgi:hypothetical protein